MKALFINKGLAGRAAATVALLVVGNISAYAGAVPLSLTGWNQDLIAQATDANPAAGTSIEFGGGWSLYEQGSPLQSQGLPTSGSFTSAVNPSVQFQLAPYDSNNAIDGSGTLTLVTPAAYSSLSFLTLNGSTWAVTLTFSDNSTLILNGSNPGWTDTSSGQVALANFGVVAYGPTWAGSSYTGSLQMSETDFSLDASSALTLTSISFAAVSTADEVALFAVSGTPTPTPEPTTLALVGLGLVSLGFNARQRRRQ